MDENTNRNSGGNDNREENLKLLKQLREHVFYNQNSELALGLGRTEEEIKAWMNGAEIDEDAQEKIQALAEERLS